MLLETKFVRQPKHTDILSQIKSACQVLKKENEKQKEFVNREKVGKNTTKRTCRQSALRAEKPKLRTRTLPRRKKLVV